MVFYRFGFSHKAVKWFTAYSRKMNFNVAFWDSCNDVGIIASHPFKVNCVFKKLNFINYELSFKPVVSNFTVNLMPNGLPTK